MCTLGTFREFIIIWLFEFKYTSVPIILTSPAHHFRFYKHKHKSTVLPVTETHSASVGNPAWISACPSGDKDSGECARVDLGLIALSGAAPLDFLDPRVTFVSGCKVVVFTFRFLCTPVTSSPAGRITTIYS